MRNRKVANNRAVRLADVALLAQVSTATVSRYFNNPELLKPDTASNIRAAIEETGYIPNMLAGGLASQRSRLVSLLIPHISNSLFSSTIEAMISEFAKANIVVMVGVTHLDRAREEQLFLAALGRQADAIITTGGVPANLQRVLRQSRTTIVEIWDLPDEPIGFAVGFDHFQVGAKIAGFVHSRGYLRPHVVTGDGPRAAKRRAGFLSIWREFSDETPTESEVAAPSQFADGRACFARIRRLEPRPDVIVCGSDTLAQGIIVEAQAAGWSVPGDLAVIGFGNDSVAGDMRPTITSVDIDGAEIARQVVKMLSVSATDGLDGARSVDVGFRIIARDSA